ncbi:restriction endonuclease [Neolewinella aurantiaca]|uniref:Restriction endonuclease n=1 Tax=Neolewinella aurantiaca TaxID=2602767 RepID=A0A5C7FUT9_9BACT|nr:restriction endonuclease [Neolewinella aurantiaca]TXF89249.1 restriction endonuclease [Neolewinella aurantiaca]
MSTRHLTVSEHQRLQIGPDAANLQEKEWRALSAFHAAGNHHYFDLIHRGIKLKSYVGVLRVGQLTLEVLPKLDPNEEDTPWRRRLLDMLWATSTLAPHPSSAHLRTRPKNVLHYHLSLFADYTETLLRRGLVKQYRTREGNRTALRGRLLPVQQLQQNLVHRERFYVRDRVYDVDTPHNRLLRQALVVAVRLTNDPALRGRLTELLLWFPDLPTIQAIPATFDRLAFDRQTDPYREPLEIARLILLNLHPDLERGGQEVLALLFNMNQLWERFLEASLRQHLGGYRVISQHHEHYWRNEDKLPAILKPDLLIEKDGQPVAILDAKWKRQIANRPASSDLQQLYTYAHHFTVPRVALLYPQLIGARPQVQGRFLGSKVEATLLRIPLQNQNIQAWMKAIASQVEVWITALAEPI